ncbi:MAG: glycoside hydrolase, partial [Alphaproteobacteria bacterium]
GALSDGAPLPTHRIATVSADLPFNALVVADNDDAADHLMPIGTFEADPVAVAEQMLGVPHAQGARSSRATDCSGLVQQALYACGLAGPRYADQQAALGEGVARDHARRGDLVVWPRAAGDQAWTGHSALMLDARRVIHATGHHGAVVIEDLTEAEARYRADGFDAPVFRRIAA